ncbi:MAG: hypothetical protein KAS94_06545 [Desulfobulbaceae bacterium]|nr:hypothetical protein [Desulfobulbaceae bacterium]
METRHSDNDGSDIFWPGYVDATTNLILNLLFLLTILIVAVFMFALELGRTSPGGTPEIAVTSTKQVAKVISKAPIDPVKENIALRREIKRLKMMLAERVSQKVPAGDLPKSVDATSDMPTPQDGLDNTIASELEVLVRFTDESVAFTPAEHQQLLESLKPIVASGRISIDVEVPIGFSEAKRMGFYRAMAVRNLLIEMNMPTENIDVSVHEGKNDANASLVRVRSR